MRARPRAPLRRPVERAGTGQQDSSISPSNGVRSTRCRPLGSRDAPRGRSGAPRGLPRAAMRRDGPGRDRGAIDPPPAGARPRPRTAVWPGSWARHPAGSRCPGGASLPRHRRSGPALPRATTPADAPPTSARRGRASRGARPRTGPRRRGGRASRRTPRRASAGDDFGQRPLRRDDLGQSGARMPRERASRRRVAR